MKKVITAFAFIYTIGFAQAQTDTTGTKYEYYPDANVYYNDVAHNYWYYDSASTQWQNAPQLPPSYSINEKSKKNTFYYNGGNVWEKNAEHIKMYGKKSKSKKPRINNN